MPLVETTYATLTKDVADAPGDTIFVIFSSAALPEGKRWCHWCNVIEDDVVRLFGGDAYGLIVYSAQGEVGKLPSDHFVLKDLQLVGLPSIYRIEKGNRSGDPYLYDGDLPFPQMLEEYVAGPDAYEAFLKTKKGDEYEDEEERWEEHKDSLQLTRAMIKMKKELQEKKELRIKARAEAKGGGQVETTKEDKADEVKETPTICSGDICTVAA